MVPVEVHVPQAIAQVLNQQAKPIPAAVTGLALIDTGASRTCVHEPSLTSLGLNPISVVNSGTARGVVQQSVYPARLVFPDPRMDVGLYRFSRS
jgi:predicted aspartyl protease